VKRLLAVLAVATFLPGVATAQSAPAAGDVAGWLAGTTMVSGGVRFSLAPLIVLELSFEQPVYTSPEGWRAGGVISVRGNTDLRSAEAHVLAGLTATFPVEGAAVSAQLLWREILSSSSSARGSPELNIAFQKSF